MFDVIIPVTENSLQPLERCLGSLTSQSVSSWQCYIISKKPISSEFKSRYPSNKLTWIVSKTNDSKSEYRNQAVKNGTNPFLAFLDTEDTWHSNHLESFIPHTKNTASFFHTYFQEGEDYIKGRYLDSQHVLPNTASLFYRDTPIRLSTLVVPRQHFETVNGFTPQLDILEQVELTVRLTNLPNLQPQYIDELTVTHMDVSIENEDTFETLTKISDWGRINSSLVTMTKPSHITEVYWAWLRRMSGANELKGQERFDEVNSARRIIEAYAYFPTSPLSETTDEWNHLMTTEDEEWAFLEEL